MKRYLLFFVMVLLGNVIPMKSQDMLSRKAPVDKKTEPAKVIQSEKKTVNATKQPTTVKKTGPHLLFMGIPIDGSIEVFDQKLDEKGLHKSSIGNYSGRFYGQFCVANTTIDDVTGNVCEVLIRYNQLIANYTEDQLISLYNSIVRDLKKKYTNAKRNETSGNLVLSMPTGYIECKIFTTLFGKMGGGINLTIKYVDKNNSSNYCVPTLKHNEDDL